MKNVSVGHQKNLQLYMQRWRTALDGVNLRTLDLGAHVYPHLGTTALAHKIIALKSFFAYLRDGAGLLSKSEDKTQDLKVPQGKPEQQKRVKAIPHGDFLKVRKLLDGESRDALDVRARTGWHVTELVRFTNGGEVLPVRDGRAKGATLRLPRTKPGNPLLVEVPPDAARAAKRLLGKDGHFRVRSRSRAC